MKQNFNKIIGAAALAVLILNTAVATPPPSYTIYNNAAGYNGYAFNVVDGQELGTEITLDSQTWALTKYQIQYNATSLDTGVGFNIRIFANDNAGAPGNIVYDGGFYTGLAVGNHTITYDNSDFGNLYLAPFGSYTFAISFNNLGSSVIQLPLANSPSGQPGTSYGDYWRNDGTYGTPAWNLVSPSFGQANLLMNVEGTPEPSVMALSALGGVLLLGVNKLRRKRA
jgi:hypothetical protein